MKLHWATLLVLCVAAQPHSTAAAPFVYVANAYDDTVTVIDTATDIATGTVPVGRYPHGGAVNPLGTRVYVTNFESNDLSIIDAATNRVVTTVAGLVRPNQVAIAPSGRVAYITHNTIPGQVSVLDLGDDTLEAAIRIYGGDLPSAMAVSPDGLRLYVVNTWDSSENNPCYITGSNCTLTVSVIDTAFNTQIGQVRVGPYLQDIAINPAGTRLYVTNSLDLAVIDTSTNLPYPTWRIPGGTFDVVVHPRGDIVYATQSEGLAVIDAEQNAVLTTILPGGDLGSMAITPDGERIYVARGTHRIPPIAHGTVVVIDTRRNVVVDMVTVGRGPGVIAIGPENVPFTPQPVPSPTPVPVRCPADCNTDKSVTVDELLTSVAIALGRRDLTACQPADADGDGTVTIADLVEAVGAALTGCP